MLSWKSMSMLLALAIGTAGVSAGAESLVVHLAINGRVTDFRIKILRSLPGYWVPRSWWRLPAVRSAAGG